MVKKKNKERFNFTIDKEVYKEFSEICEREGYVRSKQIENFLRKFNKENG
jgi:metal-responsive CopG/Arc/MetJ family transcriptional regulator